MRTIVIRSVYRLNFNIFLDRGGWERWFLNSTHEKTAKLMNRLEFVANVEEGVNNVTQAWFWPYAFIASKEELEYIIYTNYTDK